MPPFFFFTPPPPPDTKIRFSSFFLRKKGGSSSEQQNEAIKLVQIFPNNKRKEKRGGAGEGPEIGKKNSVTEMKKKTK